MRYFVRGANAKQLIIDFFLREGGHYPYPPFSFDMPGTYKIENNQSILSHTSESFRGQARVSMESLSFSQGKSKNKRTVRLYVSKNNEIMVTII